jgi:riboflavin synthase
MKASRPHNRTQAGRYTAFVFTGIVEALGTVTALSVVQGEGSRRLEVRTALPVQELPLGASIAVEGVCLTVVARGAGSFAADLGPETLARTTLGALSVGDLVHLERPLSVGAALGGHLVSGHVDAVGTVVSTTPAGDALALEIAAPPEVARYVVPKGSVTVAGISLTVNTMVGSVFGVTLIPHTLAVTTLGQRPVGAALNLEADLLAKHVERSVNAYLAARGFDASPSCPPPEALS